MTFPNVLAHCYHIMENRVLNRHRSVMDLVFLAGSTAKEIDLDSLGPDFQIGTMIMLSQSLRFDNLIADVTYKDSFSGLGFHDMINIARTLDVSIQVTSA